MLKREPPSVRSDRGTPSELSSILLVEQDLELRDSRRILLGSLRHPVLAVSTYAEVCELPPDSNCGLVVVSIRPSERGARRIASYARQTWPTAKILLLGFPFEEFNGSLYDDSVDAPYNPAGVVETARRLLKKTDCALH